MLALDGGGMPKPQSLVFTGHMVDLPDRETPRFPPHLEATAAKEIALRVDNAVERFGEDLIGIASAARGGDILFHEECRSRGLRTQIVLPFAPEVFEDTSVAGVPSGDWVDRFRKLWNGTSANEREVLALPRSNKAFSICNNRIVEIARQRGAFHLIALWDGKSGDGPGGTADLVARARHLGDRPDIIAPQDLKIEEVSS